LAEGHLVSQEIPIFVISLLRASERRRAIVEHLESLDLKYQIVEAVDGSQLSPEYIANIQDKNVQYHPGVIGCYLSHMHIYEKMDKENIGVALILEDDARLKSKFVPAIRRGLHGNGFDLLLLDCAGEAYDTPIFVDLKSKEIVFEHFHMYKPNLVPAGLYAYIVTLRGARRRLGIAFPIRGPIDFYKAYPSDIDCRVLYNPKGAGLSRFDRQSFTSDRNDPIEVSFAAIRSTTIYRKLRKWLKLRPLSDFRAERHLRSLGVLHRNGRWRRLPPREWIL
jgi:glycosyl transferase, family 25